MGKAVYAYVNNKDADLISAFVVRCLNSLIPILAKSKIQDSS